MRTISELGRMDGRVAVLTGGAGYIGLAAAETLLELGATVAILDRDQAACDSRVATLERFGRGRSVPISCDLEDEGQIRASVKRVVADMKRLDVIVHAASYVGTTKMPGLSVRFEDQSVAAFEASVRVNAVAAFVLAQEARTALVASGHGSIVLFGSIYGLVGPDMRLYEGTSMSNSAAYNASKGASMQLVRYLATVLAPEVRVNAISPGGVLRDQVQQFQERYNSRVPLGRMATEEDMKGAIAYLSSDLSAYVTGQNIIVDGGWTAW